MIGDMTTFLRKLAWTSSVLGFMVAPACASEPARRHHDDDDALSGQAGEDMSPSSGGRSGSSHGGTAGNAGSTAGDAGHVASGGTDSAGSGGDVQAQGGAGASTGEAGGDSGGEPGSGGTANDSAGGEASGGTSSGSGAVGGSTSANGGSAGESAGTGGAGANAGGGGASGGANSGGTGGTGGSAGAGACGNLIDDMESGTGYICEGNGRVGSWFSYVDAQGSFSPAGDPVPTSVVSPARDGSQRAMHAYGTRVDYAGFGFWMSDVPITYDASAYTGIRFYAKGTPGTLKVIVQTAATESTTYGGDCTLPTLSCAGNDAGVSLDSSAWALKTVPFSELRNGTAPFDKSDIWSIEFQPEGAGSFDYWIDDLSFY